MTDKAIAPVSDDQLHWRPDEEANSIAIVMRHMAGNLRFGEGERCRTLPIGVSL